MTLGAVQWAGPFLPEYKLSPGLAMLPNVAELIVHVLAPRVPFRAGYCASAATSAPGLASSLPQLRRDSSCVPLNAAPSFRRWSSLARHVRRARLLSSRCAHGAGWSPSNPRRYARAAREPHRAGTPYR
jgi:hypothetical protein